MQSYSAQVVAEEPPLAARPGVHRMRQEFSRKTKSLAWDRCGGKCEGPGCGLPLQLGRYTYDHRIPDWIGGANTLDNVQVLCRACDKAKTRKDQATIARVRGAHDRHIGAKVKSARPFPCGKDTPYKRKIGGGVVPR